MSAFLLTLMMALSPASAVAQGGVLNCVQDDGQKTFLLFRSYRLLSSYISIGGVANYRWSGDEPVVHHQDILLAVSDSASQNEVFSVANGRTFLKFQPTRPLGGNKKSTLFVETALVQGGDRGFAIEISQGNRVRALSCSNDQ